MILENYELLLIITFTSKGSWIHEDIALWCIVMDILIVIVINLVLLIWCVLSCCRSLTGQYLKVLYSISNVLMNGIFFNKMLLPPVVLEIEKKSSKIVKK